MKLSNAIRGALGVGVFLIAVPCTSFAITATELIVDAPPLELANKDLERTRTDSNGYFNFEDNDATIAAQNSVSAAFGLVNSTDVSWTHDLTWLTPPPGAFLNASLTILAWGNIGGDDQVIADAFNIGNLTNGTIATLGFSSSNFSTNNPVTLTALFTDGLLSVTVNKNAPGGLANLNAFSVYSSELTVTYDAVPEPTSMLLLGSGLLGLARLRRRSLVA